MHVCGDCGESVERQGRKFNLRYCEATSPETSPLYLYLCQRCRRKYRDMGFKLKLVI
jgi:hypothetical protein